jgi:TonB family protein
MNGIRRVLAGLLVLYLSGPAGFAATAVEEFNAAVQRGDLGAATDAAVAAWPTVAGDAANAPRLAREFGFAAYRAGRMEVAQRFAGFLAGPAGVPPKFDDEPATSGVLVQLVAWKSQPDPGGGKALLDTLDARVAADATVDAISIQAAQELLSDAWGRGAWRDADRAAGLLARLAARAGAASLPLQRHAEIRQVAVRFMDDRTVRQYEAMADLYERIVTDIERVGDAASRDRLQEVRYQAMAWVSAIGAYLASEVAPGPGKTRNPVGEGQAHPFGTRPLRVPRPDAAQGQSTETVMPRCRGGMNGVPEPKYPPNERYRGIVGAVVVSAALGEDGKVQQSRVLVAVPGDAFDSNVLRAVNQWRFVVAADEDRTRCRVADDAYIINVTFMLN